MSLEYCKISDIASSASVLPTHLFEAEASGTSVSVSASVLADYIAPIVSTSSAVSALLGTISKGRIVGGRLYYSASNTTILEKIGYHFNDGVSDSWVETSANTSITPAMTNFPAASSWSFICGDASGNITLEAATGAYNQRPTNNEFLLTGGSVGFDDIGKNGYYINGKRILRVFHKISTTSFYFIILADGIEEYGENYNGEYDIDKKGEMKAWSNRSATTDGAASVDTTWTFPVGFSKTPTLPLPIIDNASSTGAQYVQVLSSFTSTTSIVYRVADTVGAGTTYKLLCTAFGKYRT